MFNRKYQYHIRIPSDLDATSNTQQDTSIMMIDSACDPPAVSTNSSASDSIVADHPTLEINAQDIPRPPELSSDLAMKMAKRESKQIFWLRNLLAIVLVVATSIAAYFVYNVTRDGQVDQFQTHFDDNAIKLVDTLTTKVKTSVGAIDNAAILASPDSTATDGQWPNVVIPLFEVRGASSRSLAGAELLSVVPLVTEVSRAEWESFAINNTEWIEEGLEYESRQTDESAGVTRRLSSVIHEMIYEISEEDHSVVVDTSGGPYFPIWQTTPVHTGLVNYNVYTHGSFGSDLNETLRSGGIVIGRMADISSPDDPFHSFFRSSSQIGRRNLEQSPEYLGPIGEIDSTSDYGEPVSFFAFPVFDQLSEPRSVVGILASMIYWTDFLKDSLSEDSGPFNVVLSNACGQVCTLQVSGDNVIVLGHEDLSDSSFKNEAVEFQLIDLVGDIQGLSAPLDKEYCPYTIAIYPTSELQETFYTSEPALYSFLVVALFLLAAAVFIFYDFLVSLRQKRIARRAAETTAVVNSLFPANVRDRLFNKEIPKEMDNKKLNTMFDSQLKGHCLHNTLPIADLFPRSTVLFADIAGFTAWASSREPTQVFLMLETIYGKFDALAKEHGVFKVETIGDCYVAATGVPEQQSDHAVRMVNFAQACLEKISSLTKELESSLGPDTGNLSMRFGLHSGPVTAGVLRGEKSRFQLFGDTVNTASRMESTGSPGKIQCSEATAKILQEAGEGQRLEEREETVHAKGKGAIRTFWVLSPGEVSTHCDSTLNDGYSYFVDEDEIDRIIERRKRMQANTNARLERLIDWNVDVLHRQLRNLMATRNPEEVDPEYAAPARPEGIPPMADVKEAVVLPHDKADLAVEDPDELQPQALSQLRDYVKTIAYMYHNTNPFHNFDHSAHVSLSAQKLLSRIVAPRGQGSTPGDENPDGDSANFAYGINADPLTHFAILFSTMIHDVDHSGVTNLQLIEEKGELAQFYENKSIAEQNSIDIAWDLLMEPAFDVLRSCIFSNQEEHDRFRGLVVNSVIATDIFDKELKEFRQRRWDKAFSLSTPESSDSQVNDVDLKATIVIEHLIQASDVSHTMQHWHVYQSWNEKLFAEMYKAYKNGRMAKNPAESWYEGELGFFDHYVIPLAKKLFDCGVFGVSSDEYLQYAMENRGEWEFKGKTLVSRWVDKYRHQT